MSTPPVALQRERGPFGDDAHDGSVSAAEHERGIDEERTPIRRANNISELESKTLSELREIARSLDVNGYTGLKKQDLVFRVLQAQTEQQGNYFREGVLDIVEEGFG